MVYCGTILTAENKEKKVNIDFEPFKPINTSLYLCDNKFHTEVIKRGSWFKRLFFFHRFPEKRAFNEEYVQIVYSMLFHIRVLTILLHQALNELLEDDDKFGFVIMDGNGSLFGTLCGNTRSILHKFSVDLPKKHGRGGQSALRFARLRLEKRRNYIRKVRSTNYE